MKSIVKLSSVVLIVFLFTVFVSSANGTLSSTKQNNTLDEQSKKDYSEPGFLTGLWHGLTSPLRTFGLFDLHYEEKIFWTDSYIVGLMIGSLIILSIGIGIIRSPSFFKKNKTR